MPENFEFLLYRSAEEDVSVNAVIKDESIWLTQRGMAELFDVQTPAISKHLRNIFDDGELDEKVVVSKMEITTPHGAMERSTVLQSRCNHLRGISCQLQKGHAFSYLGDQRLKRVHAQGLCSG